MPSRPAIIIRRSSTAAGILAAAVAVATAAQTAAAQTYVYGYGPLGLRYYLVARPPAPAIPAPVVETPAAAAPAPAPYVVPRLTLPAAPDEDSWSEAIVGPGARNWATGNRLPAHRPWLRARD